MFPHFNLTRRPVYTYRRKTKLEFISDSSDDDSDLEDQKHQQRQGHTMVKVHEEGVSPFAGQNGAIEDKSIHIKSTTNDTSQPAEENAPSDEHVTPTATMNHQDHEEISAKTNITAATLVNGHLEKTNILEHTMSPPVYEPTLESHAISLDTFTTTCKQDLEPLPTENSIAMDDIHLSTQANEEMDIFAFPSDSTTLATQSATTTTTTSSNDATSLATQSATTTTTTSSNDTTSLAEDDIFAFPTDPDDLVTPKAPKQKHVKKKNEEMDIFDFPEDDPGEIRLMVASSLQTKSTATTLSSPSSSSSFISTTSSSSSRKSRRQKSVRFAPNLIVSTFRKASLQYSEPKLYPMPCTEEQPPPTPSLHYLPQKSQKRKRNLVSRLKSANGQEINDGAPMPSYNFDDDDLDEADTGSVPEPSPERDENLPQDIWMKMIEEALNDNDEDHEQRRPTYQPQNPMNVKVTYTRQSKKHPRNSQSDQELAELDNLLATLRNCK